MLLLSFIRNNNSNIFTNGRFIRSLTKKNTSSSSLFDLKIMNFSIQTSNANSEIIKGTISKGGNGISIGDYAQVKRIFSVKEVKEYGELIGDNNPIHLIQNEHNEHNEHNEISSSSSPSSSSYKVIVHGIFTASLFSSIFGSLIPGSVYRSQSFNFHSPVYTDECIIGKVEVTNVKDLRSRGLLVTCDTSILKKDCKDADVDADSDKDADIDVKHPDEMIKCVDGVAQVWLPGAKMY